MKFVLALESSKTTVFGGHGGGVTPVPIPNTEVKPTSADGTWEETPWESRTPPDFSVRIPPPRGGGIRRFPLQCVALETHAAAKKS